MTALLRLLEIFARQGRILLIGGLALGIAAPALARAMEPLIVPLIMVMLVIAAARIGPFEARLRPGALPRALLVTVTLQTAMPLAGIGVLAALGVLDAPWALGVVLALAGAPITGSPGLAILSRADPVPALRQVVLGTALLPLTVLPVFWLMPVLEDPRDMLGAAARLLAIILVSGAVGFWLHARFAALRAPEGRAALDGAMALNMAVVVIALMAAVGPALWAGEAALWALLALVLGLNFASQLAVAGTARALGAGMAAPAMGIVAGNRNLAIFLGALPSDIVASVMLFVGVYQVPMYFTPLVMTAIYRRMVAATPG